MESPLYSIHSNIDFIPQPSINTGVAATLAALMHQFVHSEWQSHEAIVQKQLNQLAVLVDYAAKQSPYFKQKCEETGAQTHAIDTLEGLRQLPILTRSDIQKAGDQLHCKEVPKSHLPTSKGRSSGSTGEPVTVYKTNINNLFWQANMMREHLWHQRNFSGRLLIIRSGIEGIVTQNGWGPPVNTLYKSGQTMGMSVHSSSKDILRVIKEFRPEHLNIYPSTLDGLMNYCVQHNQTVEGIKHIWCISETLSPATRQRAKDFLGASIEDDYSTNEIGIIALQCPVSGLYHVMAESVLVEIVDDNNQPCAPGEVGRVLVTSLVNFATPIIRYELGDWAQAGDVCPCGRGLPTIHSIKGRTRNLVVKPDGSRHWPSLTVAVFLSELPIIQFQLIQHALDDIEVRLVTARPFTKADEALFTEHLHKVFEHPFPLRFVYFEERLPLAVNGKREDFICKI